MPKQIRYSTKYPGVYYIMGTHPNGKPEKIFYIRYRKDEKMVEEKAGRQFQNDMTPARASMLRTERLNGVTEPNVVKREREKEQQRKNREEPTFNEIWNIYKKNNDHLKSIRRQGYQYNKHIRPVLGNKRPSQLTMLQIDRIRISLTKNISIHVAGHVIRQIRQLVNYAVSRQLCKPIEFKIKPPKYDDRKTEDLTSEQIERLLKVLDEESNIDAADIVRLALYTGMRRGEMLKLRWDDIDFERGLIYIREPKGGVNVSIPLNASARNVLETHPRKGKSPYVFSSSDGKQRHRHSLVRPLQRIKENAGLPEDFRPLHGLRHVFASMLASSGKVDMYTLQKLLTHKSPLMTQRYAHLRDDALRRASGVVDDIFREMGKKDQPE